jgi:uncharacterized protein (DUF2062 family)
LRDDGDPEYPAKSRIGRRLSNFFVRLESGASVSDSQCGLRVYPLEMVRFVGCRSGRYAFETEILTRAVWAGCELVHVPVTCRYFSERISHFRPWVDTVRSIAMHAPLAGRALLPVRHRLWPGAPLAPSRKTFLQSLNPAHALRELRDEPAAASTLALALALGVFIANLPIYGLHAIVALYTSRRLHLNPLAALLGTQISTPPIGAFLGAAAIAVGHLLLHGALPVMAELNVSQLGWRNVVGPFLVDWVVGGSLVGFALAAITFAMSLPLLRMARQRDAQEHPKSMPTVAAP